MPLPRIAVTMGDPAGIGPEICLRLLADAEIAKICTPIVFGDWLVLEEVAKRCGLPPPLLDSSASFREVANPCVFDFANVDRASLKPGRVDAATGRASFEYVAAAIDAALAGEVQAVVTGPIHKDAWHQAGINYPGHTELFAERTKATRTCMMLTSDAITCSLVTTHVGLGEVAGLLRTERILEVIELTNIALFRLRGRAPRIVVCGLNPHAGEHGLFGAGEEERLIAPAVAAARARGLDVIGPVSPDTAFLPSIRRETDGYVCMYHDQGLIPLKALAFDEAVNITLGLPIIRTSVDHGTACDIAWQGRADASSLLAAVRLAARLAHGSISCRNSSAE